MHCFVSGTDDFEAVHHSTDGLNDISDSLCKVDDTKAQDQEPDGQNSYTCYSTLDLCCKWKGVATKGGVGRTLVLGRRIHVRTAPHAGIVSDRGDRQDQSPIGFRS